MTSAAPADNNLLIIGAGVLGRMVAEQWQHLHPGATVIGETNTTTNHDLLKSLNITPAISGSTASVPSKVVFCAPPSGSPDYPGALGEAVGRLTENNRIVFTSSGSVHGSKEELITETTAQCVDEERSKRLADAENHVLNYHNGLVVRLSGLYTLQRGAHSFWLKTGKVMSAKNRHLNLIHYADAASAVVQALQLGDDQVQKLPRRNFLACSNKVVTPLEILEVSLKHDMYKQFDMPEFQKADSKRTYDNTWSRETLNWTPKWESYVDFMLQEINE